MTIDELIEGKSIPTPHALREAIEEFLIDREEKCSPEIRAIARKCLAGAELRDFDDLFHIVQARPDDCGPIMKQIAAGVALSFATFGFGGGITKSREHAAKLALILKRDAGVEAPPGVAWPDPEDDPEIADKFKPREEMPVEPSGPPGSAPANA